MTKKSKTTTIIQLLSTSFMLTLAVISILILCGIEHWSHSHRAAAHRKFCFTFLCVHFFLVDFIINLSQMYLFRTFYFVCLFLFDMRDECGVVAHSCQLFIRTVHKINFSNYRSTYFMFTNSFLTFCPFTATDIFVKIEWKKKKRKKNLCSVLKC